MKINEVLLKPMLTEKGTNLAAKKVYWFEVAAKANKNVIKNAVESIYKVKVSEIKTLVRKGKARKVGRKMSVKQLPNKKLAFIKLKEGKIDLFPQA